MIVQMLPARTREFFSSCKFRVLAAFTKKSVSGPDERDITGKVGSPSGPSQKNLYSTDPFLARVHG